MRYRYVQKSHYKIRDIRTSLFFKKDPKAPCCMGRTMIKYKIFLLKEFRIKNTAITEAHKKIAKRDALFFTFFGSIKCFRWFCYEMKRL